MDSPIKEITPLIKSLTQGTPAEQEHAFRTHFLPSASFSHPFCYVPSFDTYNVPYANFPVDSRWLILMIYRWYRILSPQIEFSIDNAVHDEKTNTLYLELRQIFTFFFFPIYHANVKLTTVLRLEPRHVGPDGNPLPASQTNVNGPSYAAVADPSDDASARSSGNGNGEGKKKKNNSKKDNSNSGSNGNTPNPNTRLYIASQEDLYQTTEFLKFVAPWFGAPLLVIWQLFATFMSVLGAAVLAPFSWLDVRGKKVTLKDE